MPAIDTIKLRRGTAAAWTSANPVLAAGEEGWESDTGKRKVGDGVTAWVSLAYDTFDAAPAGSNTQVQYNASGAFAGSSSLTFNSGTGALSATSFVGAGTGLTGTATSLTAGTASAVAVGGITGLGTGVSTFLATPTSANLAAAVTNETGSGLLVFATSPTLTTPVLGVAAATSLTLSNPLNLAYGGTSIDLTASTDQAIVGKTSSNTWYMGGWTNMVFLSSNRNDATGAIGNSGQACASVRCWTTNGEGYITFNSTTANNANPNDNMELRGDGRLMVKHIAGFSSAPAIAAGVGAGTSPTIAIAGTDLAGTVTLTTGTLPTGASTVFTITWNIPYQGPMNCVFFPNNDATAAVASLISASSPGGTTTVVRVALTGLGAGVSLSWSYNVMG